MTNDACYMVFNLYMGPDRWANPVTCAVGCGSLEAAKKKAREKAEDILAEYNVEMRFNKKPEKAFDDVWREYEHCDGIETEWGYDCVDSRVSFVDIRVVKAERCVNE